MPIAIEQARALVTNLGARQVATLFAQAHAKHVLHEVKVATDNFPAFDPSLHDKVTFSAYALLAAGCSILEQGDRHDGAAAIERAASLLTFTDRLPRSRARADSIFSLQQWPSTRPVTIRVPS